jgi:hypothetical protein
MEKKKLGRPKTKEGRKITFYLANHIIAKLRMMTSQSQNMSKFIEDLIEEKYNATQERKRLEKS